MAHVSEANEAYNESLSFLLQVKAEYGSDSEIYVQWLEAMSQFGEGKLSSTALQATVEELLHDKPHLLQKFKNFLPLDHDRRDAAGRSRGRHASVTNPGLRNLDPLTAFLYKPRTITFLLIGLCCLIKFSGVFDVIMYGDKSHELSNLGSAALQQRKVLNSTNGVWACIAVILAFSITHGPEPPMIRPHPAVWRTVHGIALSYSLLLTYLLFLDASEAREFMKFLDSDLGVEPEERSYGANCALWMPDKSFNWDVVKETVLDIFVIAHTVGWWAKALFMRDYTLLFIMSIGFEFCELTFKHLLPNFNECWWDSWILDFALCNTIGIIAGMQTNKYFGSRMYNWRGLSEQRNVGRIFVRTLQQFTPYSWEKYAWNMFSTPLRLVQVSGFVIIMLTSEVNAFFLKYVLWVPPESPINTYRLFIWFFMAFPAIRQYLDYIDGRGGSGETLFTKIGVYAWLCLAVVSLEVLVIIKFAQGHFNKPWPAAVKISWIIGLTLYITYICAWQIRIWVRQRKLRRQPLEGIEHDKDQ